MRAISLNAPGQFQPIDIAEPAAPGPGEALVRVHRVGICGTDLHAYRGRQPFFSYPRILGHELAVEVLALGAGDTPLAIGDRCSVEPYLNCGHCIACRRGKTNCCATLQTLGVHTDGGMRERIILPTRKLHPANDLALDQLALVETLGIGAHAVARAQIEATDTVLVIGAGPIGLSVMQFARLQAQTLIVMDMNDARLAFAKQHMRVDHCVQAGDSALEAVTALTNGDLPTVVIDATGSAASMIGAFQFVAPGGKLIFAGLVQADISFHDPHLHRREITVMGSRNALASDFTRIISLIRAGTINTQPWVTHHVPAAAMIGNFESWLQPETGVIKAITAW